MQKNIKVLKTNNRKTEKNYKIEKKITKNYKKANIQ